MTQITVRIKPSFSKLAQKFGSIRVTRFLQDKIKQLAFLIEREAKQVTPVDTGRLRASVRVLPNIRPLGAVIQPHTNYAIYVHEGTRYMRARPFMFWGAKTASEDFEPKLAKDLEREFGRKLK